MRRAFREPVLLGAHPHTPFPSAELALDEPDGLVCVGGDLSPPRLLNAYASGLFPWFNEDQPILWWSPAVRMVFRADGVHLSQRFRRSLRASTWTLRFNTAFDAIMAGCAEIPRAGQRGTWILPAMQRAYAELHRLGHAHSIEVWEGQRLVGGLYGVSVGRAFHAESMFSAESGASKLAMAGLSLRLVELGWPLFDAQMETPHLASMGGMAWPRALFLETFAPLAAGKAPCPDFAGPPVPACALAA